AAARSRTTGSSSRWARRRRRRIGLGGKENADGLPSGRWGKSPRVYQIRSKIEPRYGHSSPSLINTIGLARNEETCGKCRYSIIKIYKRLERPEGRPSLHVRHATAVSFGSSIVPLNFGG